MKIYCDENMPFAQQFFSEFGDVISFPGREVSAEDLKDADVLLVRSITKVNQALLKNNKNLKFVGTATIGIDHIDQEFLKQQGISFSSSPGCNAVSVADYVISSLTVLAERYLLTLSDLTVGIVGAGNTGSRLSEKLTAYGINFVMCDPLLENSSDKRDFVSLEQALSCDVISLHVPLTQNCDHETFHLLDETKLKALKDSQILINACRGEVVDNAALLRLKQMGHGLKLVWDVWEKEPNILLELIDYTEIATAHIAGYSLEGKARGTEMLYQALCQQLNILPSKSLNDFLPAPVVSEVEINQVIDEKILNQLVKIVYDVRRDDGIFRQKIKQDGFDSIRKNYPARREFSSLTIRLKEQANRCMPLQLGFGV